MATCGSKAGTCASANATWAQEKPPPLQGQKAEGEEGQPGAQATAPSTAAGETGADRKNEKTGEETAAIIDCAHEVGTVDVGAADAEKDFLQDIDLDDI